MYRIKPYEYDSIFRILRDITSCDAESRRFMEAIRKAKLMYKKIGKRYDKDRTNKA